MGASSEESEEITDADLSKAASEAARTITPKGVVEVLKMFSVSYLGDLDQAQRREFIDLLNEAV